jgi:phage terminase large subunit-like protein
MSKRRGRREAAGKRKAAGEGNVPGERGNSGQWKKGQSGNPGGKRKTLARTVTEAFVRDFFGAWAKRGEQAIEDVIANYPDVSLYAAAALVPKDIKTKSKPMIDDNARLAARILAAGADVRGAADAPSPEARESPPFRPHARGSAALWARSGRDSSAVDKLALDPTRGEGREKEDDGLYANALAQREAETNLLARYRPYPPQREFHDAGAIHDERCLMAGNQLGKTLAGAMEWAMHLTGRYPDWWKGKVFDRPVRMWAAGVTAESTRDNPQRVLIGTPQQKETWGTGTIPKDAIKEWTPSYQLGDSLDTVVVRWGGGGDLGFGESVLAFKSYEKGREKWQGETLDGVWFDEEPPLDIYCEGRTRTVAKRGIVMLTFTPLQSMTELVKLFLSEAELARLRERKSEF